MMRELSYREPLISTPFKPRRQLTSHAPTFVVEPLEFRRLLSATLTTLAVFDGSNGNYPDGGMIADSGGNLYGTTSGAGGGHGTVYEVVAGSGSITTLFSFNGTNGSGPSSLILDAAGDLYGITEGGGAYGGGTVFEIAAGTHALTTLISFNGSNASELSPGLTLDSAGNLYGAIFSTASTDGGAIVEIAAGTHALSTLVTFDGTNGWSPSGGMIVDSAGNLYGTTQWGGITGNGTVFEIAAGSHALTTLVAFNGTNGSEPNGGLVFDAAGNLYGTTQWGGTSDWTTLNEYNRHGYGTLFRIAVGTKALTTLVAFNNTNGADPASPILDGAGNLYGIANNTVFEFAMGSNTLATPFTYDADVGEPLGGGLVADSAGNLYGTILGSTLDIPTDASSVAADRADSAARPSDAVIRSYHQGMVFELSGTGFVASTKQPVYRLYSPVTAEHLFTSDQNESNTLQTRGWIDEEVAFDWYSGPFTLGGVSDEPMYRLYDPTIQQHLWTTDLNEYNTLATRGWNQEGVAGYVFPTAVASSVPVYRLSLAMPALHLWTTDLNEYDTLTGQDLWSQEGIVGYVV